MLTALTVTAVATFALLCLAVLRWVAARNVEDVFDDTAEDTRPELPEGHRPPAGLGPISPSERFLSVEVERGLRALEEYLLDVA